MMLTGKNIQAVKAKKMGLVDVVVDPFALESSALAAAQEKVKDLFNNGPHKSEHLSHLNAYKLILSNISYKVKRHTLKICNLTAISHDEIVFHHQLSPEKIY